MEEDYSSCQLVIQSSSSLRMQRMNLFITFIDSVFLLYIALAQWFMVSVLSNRYL